MHNREREWSGSQEMGGAQQPVNMAYPLFVNRTPVCDAAAIAPLSLGSIEATAAQGEQSTR